MSEVVDDENRKFPLEKEIVGLEDEGALEENEVVSEDDDVKPARLSTKVDILDDDFEEPPANKRSDVTPSASEDVDSRSRLTTKRSPHVCLRLAETHAWKKVKARRRMQEVPDNAVCSKTTLQPQLSSDQ
ncbi:hypothetical protein AXG93_4541s1000 [Marchantia polymorpha subsp. ruderalis]|uniref:Uncharacterized protein n=1 Tax=Marchantia polymorpha subsp. ruderalis TaxID=1480154 RepID=A0A176VT37_MARPO|nr:hypothetical protein AXG93_4541s1000 [Marchantia polymorpha subsp. ruderalis]